VTVDAALLETTLATEFVPGTNVKGQVAGANWSFLLPSLEARLVVALGDPRPAALRTLARLAGRVVVLCASPRELRRVEQAAAEHGLANVAALAIEGGRLPLRDGSADLLSIATRAGLRVLRHRPSLAGELLRLLHREGSIQLGSGNVPPALAEAIRSAGRSLEPCAFRVTPRLGEVRSLVPEGDAPILAHFARTGLEARLSERRPLRRLEEHLARQRGARSLFARRTLILRSEGSGSAGTPPRYLRDLAREAGLDLDGHRIGLAAPGLYESRKVLGFLFAPGAEAPSALVKMTRSRGLNLRLENEHRALTALARMTPLEPGVVPQPLFFGHHGGLAMLGETVLEGTSLRARSDGRPDCPYVATAVDWLTRLAARTADPVAATPGEVAAGIERLFRRFLEIYGLDPGARRFLAQQIERIAGAEAVPLVFQHGDPGVWNLLVAADGRIVFLDWEAAEPKGLPLWDLFYLLRSHCMRGVRSRGREARLRALGSQLLEPSPFAERLAGSTHRYCATVGLSPSLVEPLFYTCWMHRSLKEATRTPASRLASGHYASLLRLAIERRESPALRRLFG
jgi:hypothetical protein